jgi:hypothetical protein
MHKKGLLASYMVDFYAYLAFAILVIVFYFVFVGGKAPIIMQSDMEKLNLESTAVSLHYLGIPLKQGTNLADYVALSAADHSNHPRIRAFDPVYVSPYQEVVAYNLETHPYPYAWDVGVWSDYHYYSKKQTENYPYYRIRTQGELVDAGRTVVWLPSADLSSMKAVAFDAKIK